MGCSPFGNSRFQMGVTEMGFAEDFGLSVILILTYIKFTESNAIPMVISSS